MSLSTLAELAVRGRQNKIILKTKISLRSIRLTPLSPLTSKMSICLLNLGRSVNILMWLPRHPNHCRRRVEVAKIRSFKPRPSARSAEKLSAPTQRILQLTLTNSFKPIQFRFYRILISQIRQPNKLRSLIW